MARILAVDDMRSMRDLVKAVLEKRGHEVITQEDGEQALAYARNPGVDLVLTDINMPNLDGVGLVRELRQLESCARTPILILTTEGSDESKNEARDAGANGWIQKPFDPERLSTAIEKTSKKYSRRPDPILTLIRTIPKIDPQRTYPDGFHIWRLS